MTTCSGTGEPYTAEAQTTYPNGEVWHTVDILEFRNGMISRVREYFGPPYPPPEWRSKWVEKEDVAGLPREKG